MGLEQLVFRVMEIVSVVELCAIVTSPDCTCPIAFPFEVILSTDDGTAGKVPIKLTLGAHAQRGLRSCSVCVCCVSVSTALIC